MKTIVVFNQKGGTGKSLIADELTFSFERSGIPVSFYDLDSQGGTIHKTFECPDAQVTVVDTPGALVESLKTALSGADLAIVPVRPTSRDMEPLLRMRKIVQAAGVPVFYVLNAWNRYRASSDFFAWLKGEVGDSSILVLPQSELFVQAGAGGVSAVAYARNSSVALAVIAMCNAVRKKLGFVEEQGNT